MILKNNTKSCTCVRKPTQKSLFLDVSSVAMTEEDGTNFYFSVVIFLSVISFWMNKEIFSFNLSHSFIHWGLDASPHQRAGSRWKMNWTGTELFFWNFFFGTFFLLFFKKWNLFPVPIISTNNHIPTCSKSLHLLLSFLTGFTLFSMSNCMFELSLIICIKPSFDRYNL